MNILLPPTIEPNSDSIVFLAGPIQGTSDWQTQAIAYLHSKNPSLVIASPRREYLDGTFAYAKQVDWETHYLNHAAQNGVILFWLAKEVDHIPERAYAQTTRFELAEWKARHEVNRNIRLVVGIEDGFSGARYIRHRLSQDCPDVLIGTSLHEVCDYAIQLL